MIKITAIKDSPGYAGPSVEISITQALQPSDLTHIVKQAVETGHLEAILKGLPEGYFQDARDNIYMVSKDNGRAPSYVHSWKEGSYKSAFESACEEADRLARKEPGTYRVLRIVRTIKSKEVSVIEIFSTT